MTARRKHPSATIESTRPKSELRPGEVDDAERKRAGRYYTPRQLVDFLIRRTLIERIDRELATATDRADAERRLLDLRIVDPACGIGNFLIPAARTMARAVARVRHPRPDETVDKSEFRSAYVDVVNASIYGRDLDALAVDRCRRALIEDADVDPSRSSPLAERVKANIVVGDGLFGPFETTTDQEMIERSSQFDRTYDVVLANPPFVNGVEGSVDDRIKARLRLVYPELDGAVDLSHYFLVSATRIAAVDGSIGFVVPRGALNARSLERFRRRLTESTSPLRPNVICCPSRADFFPGAQVYVALITLGENVECRCSLPERRTPLDESLDRLERRGRIDRPNWWTETLRIARRVDDGWNQVDETDQAPRTSSTLGERFEVTAGMTAGEAYRLIHWIVDREDCRGELKLLTTGLIDPGRSYWGERPCRYLKSTYRHPHAVVGAEAPSSIQRRIESAKRPKIVVAGLSKRVECLFDPIGEYLPAVATFCIRHPADDVEALRQLADRLNGDAAAERFHAELGGNAMGGGNTTMTKAFLRLFPLD